MTAESMQNNAIRKQGKRNTAFPHRKSGDEGIVSAPLSHLMDVDFTVSENGNARLLFAKPVQDLISWAEYDADMEDITLIFENGRIQTLGLSISAGLFLEPLREIATMDVVRLDDNMTRIGDIGRVPLVVRDARLMQ